MTTLQVLLHVAAQRDYELHSLDFSTAFLQGSLHEEIWLRRPPGFTGSFPAGTQWSLRRPVYGLRQAPREWHDTLRTTLAALGFAPSTADPSLFLRTDTSLPPFYILVYIDDLYLLLPSTFGLSLGLPWRSMPSYHLLAQCWPGGLPSRSAWPCLAAAALGASESGTLLGTAPAQALHTFTLDSGASACFFRDSTTLNPLSAPVPVRLADPSGGPVVTRSSTILPYLAVPSGSLSGFHLPSFSMNLVSTAALQDAMVTTTTPGGQRVSICTCTRTWRHLATFTRRPGSSLYTLATEPPQVAASAQLSASGQSHCLSSPRTDSSFESAAASALVAELLDFAAAYLLDYAIALVAESESASPPSVGGECALGTDVLEDRQEDFECLAAAVPRFASMLLAPEGDPDAPDIPTPRSYAEAITGPYSSQWQAAMDAEMASWKSTGTYDDEVPPLGANRVDGMWIFRVKWLPGSPPAFKARYVARGFSQRQGVDYFNTFSSTQKMTTLRVLLHVAAQRDYELQGSLHEEIWLRLPPGFTGSFPGGTRWSLRRPVYGLRQALRKWHNTLRTTLAALGFAPSTADSWVSQHRHLAATVLRPRNRHTCTDLGELRSYLGLQITRDRARRTITLTKPHMVHQVLQRFGFQFSSPQHTPLSTGHSLSAPPLDESVEPSGPYPELVGCL
ncbi:unnamed protein product, partial [Closterium sp. NIES-54]